MHINEILSINPSIDKFQYSCGPEDGLIQIETCRPANFILDTVEECVVFDGL